MRKCDTLGGVLSNSTGCTCNSTGRTFSDNVIVPTGSTGCTFSRITVTSARVRG